MPYAGRVFASGFWQVGYRPDADTDLRLVSSGTAGSLPAAQAAIDAAITTDRLNRTQIEGGRTVVFRQVYPD